MDRGLSGGGVEGMAQGLAIQSYDFPFGQRAKGLYPSDETASEGVRVQAGEQTPKGVFARNAVGQLQAQSLFEPSLLGLSKRLHVFPALGSTQNGTEGDGEDVHQSVFLRPFNARVAQEGKVLDKGRKGHPGAPKRGCSPFLQ